MDPVPPDDEIPPGFWFLDPSHAPRPHLPIDRVLLPQVRECSRRWCEQFGYLFDGVEFREIRGWTYQRMVPLGDREGPVLPTWLMRVLVRIVPELRRRVSRAVHAYRSDEPGRLIDRWYDEWHPEMEGEIARVRDVALSDLTDAELRRHVDEALRHMLLHGALAPILRELVTTCGELLGWNATRAMELVSGTSYQSTEPARRLRELADAARTRPAVRELVASRSHTAVRRIPEVDPRFAGMLDAYLHEYGCRALGHTTLGEVTLAEAPGLVLGLIDGQIEQDYDPHRHDSDNAERRARALAEGVSRLADRPHDLDRFRRAVDRAARAYPVREDNQLYCFASPLGLLRRAALEIGRRLEDRGRIDAHEHVLFLEFEEALDALSGDTPGLGPIISRRRGERAWAERNPGPPAYGDPPPGPPSFDFLPPEGRALMEALVWNNEVIMAVGHAPAGDDGDHEVRGIAASPGRYTGTARVVMEEPDFRTVRPGDVLVCPITSPAWSVLFPVIGAIVTDTGGVLSHPAIIAREYSIPAVVATGDGTARFHDGQTVTVDGSTGRVRASS